MPYKDPEKKRAHDAARHKAKRQMERDALLPEKPIAPTLPEKPAVSSEVYHEQVAKAHTSYENYLWACGVLNLQPMTRIVWGRVKAGRV